MHVHIDLMCTKQIYISSRCMSCFHTCIYHKRAIIKHIHMTQCKNVQD